MSFSVLDTVVLEHDIPDHGLRAGDIGAVVETYGAHGLEVEFVTGAGRTAALLTLHDTDVRPLGDTDILSARPLSAA
jgi:hypothetical protein